MSDVQAVMWMCASLGTHSVHVWTSLVCVPMCEAHATHQLHSSNVSVHASPPVELLQRASTLCVWCGRARRVCTRVRVCRTTLSVRVLQEASTR